MGTGQWGLALHAKRPPGKAPGAWWALGEWPAFSFSPLKPKPSSAQRPWAAPGPSFLDVPPREWLCLLGEAWISLEGWAHWDWGCLEGGP